MRSSRARSLTPEVILKIQRAPVDGQSCQKSLGNSEELILEAGIRTKWAWQAKVKMAEVVVKEGAA